jgi:hypothetical protein
MNTFKHNKHLIIKTNKIKKEYSLKKNYFRLNILPNLESVKDKPMSYLTPYNLKLVSYHFIIKPT